MAKDTSAEAYKKKLEQKYGITNGKQVGQVGTTAAAAVAGTVASKVAEKNTSSGKTSSSEEYKKKLEEKYIAPKKEETPRVSSPTIEWDKKIGVKGYSNYVREKEEEEKAKKAKEDELEWWEKVFIAMGSSSDSTLAMHNVPTVVDALREDTSWKEPSDEWSADEKYIFGYLYETEGRKKAEEYAASVNEAINVEKELAASNAEKKKATSSFGHGVVATGEAILKSPLGGVDFLMDLANDIARGQIVSDGELSPFEKSQAITEGIGTHLNEKYGTIDDDVFLLGGKGIGDIYGLGTSIVQSSMAAAAGGGTQALIQFFGSAAAAGVDDAKARGASDDQAITFGILSGLAEAIPEAIGVEKFLKIGSSTTLKSFFMNVLKQSGVEFAEEGSTSILNNFADNLVMADLSNFNILKRQYMAQGLSEKEAEKKAWRDSVEGIIYDSVAGFISGGIHAAPMTGFQTIMANREAMNTYGESVDSLIEEGLSTPEGTRSHELATEYKAKLEQGKTLSGAEIRMMVEANEQQFTAEDTAKILEAAENRLRELGESDNVEAIAQILAKQAGGETITKAQQKVLDASTYGQRVGNELNPQNIQSGGYASDWTRDIGTNRINADLYNLAQETAGAKKAQDAPTATQAKAGAKIDSSEANSLPKDGKAVQSEFEVSDNGKTFNLETGEDIKISDIASIKDGKMTLKLEDGTEVSTDKVSFPSVGDALVYETVANLPNINAAAANVLVKNLELSDVSANVYARGIEEAYRYGMYNIPATEMLEKGAFSADLSSQQRMHAYQLGQSNYKASIKAKSEAVRKNRTTAKKTTEGKVHYDKTKAYNDRQKASIEALEKIAEALGTEFYLFESKVVNGKRQGANGWFDNEGIHIDIFAGQNGEATMLFTAAHELTHFIKKWSPEKFKTLADFLMEEYGKEGVSVNELVRAQQEKARNSKEHPRELSYDVAFEEVVADSMETMLTDGKVMEKLAKLKAQDQTLWQKIKSFIDDLVKKIKEVYEGLTPNSEEGQYVAEMKDSLERFQELFTEGLVEASENFQTIGSIDLENFADAKTTDGEQLFQYRAMETDEETYKSMLKKWGKFSDAQINNLFTTVDKAMDIIKDNLEILDYAWEADINDRAFSPVKPNSDSLYQVSIDFSTLCRKRLLQQTVQAQLQEALNRPTTREEGIAIRDALMVVQEEGRQIEIACALCYVESARMKSPAQIKKFLENREAVLKDFFASKSGGDIKARIKEAELEARERLGVGDASLKSLSNKVAAEIRAAKKEAKASYKPTAEEQKLIDAAMKMTVSDFTTPAGLENLAKNYRGLFDGYTSYVRNATKSKGIENDTWWRAGDSAGIGDTLIANMNRENGLRSQSWSDFQVIHMMDYIAAVIELSTRNSKMQAYTKVPDYVELMGKTGVMINLSLIPTRNYLGSLDYDSTEGMDYRKSLELRNKYHGTVGTICIGIDNNQIKQLLEDMTIDYVIPYHKSGMAAHIRKAMHLPTWSQYEEYQSEKNLSDAEARKNAEKYGVKLLDKTDPNYHKHTSFSEWFDLKEAQQIAKMENANPSDPVKQKKYGVMYGGYMAMQNAANNYLKLCAERGLAPVFSHKKADFTGEDNYWKVLIDRKMVDNITGEVIEQKAIQPIFEEAEVLRILNDELERYPKVKADQEYAIRRVTEKFLSGEIKGGMSSEAVAKAMQKPVDNISNTNIVETAKEMDEVKLSDRDFTPAPVFYSHMGNVVDGIKNNKIAANSVVSYLKGKGVKAEELKWSGIEAFLEGKKSVTKQELKEFVEGSMLQIGEVIKEDTNWKPVVKKTSPRTRALYNNGELLETFTQHPRGDWLPDHGSEGEVYAFGDENLADEYKKYHENGIGTRWYDYKLDGGKNYREFLFKLPNSNFTNQSMRGHWGWDAKGILAHARVQDFKVGGKKMLFIEEIQSDWHNEGQKKGYVAKGLKTDKVIRNESADAFHDFVNSDVMQSIESRLQREGYDDTARLFEGLFDGQQFAYDTVVETIGHLSSAERAFIQKAVVAENKRQEELQTAPSPAGIEDAPFRNNYHEFVLKRLIREAAEKGYDSIGWTTADIQSDRWSDEFAEGYRIEYDQDIPKFLNKYGKKWGAQVGKATIRHGLKGTEVWSMPVTEAMKNSVLTEGQVMYSDRDSDGRELSKEQTEFFKDSKVRDEQGNLLVMYHGSENDFTEFDKNRMGKNAGSAYGFGFYFTESLEGKGLASAYAYGDKVLKGYVNIKNPLSTTKKTISKEAYLEIGRKLKERHNSFGYPFYFSEIYDDARSDFELYAQINSRHPDIVNRTEDSKFIQNEFMNLGFDGAIRRFDGMAIHAVTFDSNQFKSVDNKTPTTDPDIRYSLREVDPVQPASDKWQRTSTTSEVMARFPDLWNVAAEESETRNPTQITGTVKSYRKIYDYLKAEGFDGKILDASSGLGYGTKAGIEEYGFDVEDIEPYPDKNYHPKYKDYSSLNKKYDVIISNAVLNVIPQDQRDALVVKMGELLKEGGRIFINVRGKDVENASSKVAINSDLMEYYISNTGSYQKGFTKDELVAYLQDALGDGFTVEKSNMFGAVSAVVKKNGDSIRYSLREEAPVFYSHMGKVVDGIKSEKVGANGVIPYLKGKGVKDEEIKWSGIEAFLEGKKSVTKQELKEFVEGSMLQIGESSSVNPLELIKLKNGDYRIMYNDDIDSSIRLYHEGENKWVDSERFKEWSSPEEAFEHFKTEYSPSAGRWSEYSLSGGDGYRELLFIMPNSSYSNIAMRGHWGQDAKGILAHARVQNFETLKGKMLFIEEIQSDWHNAGRKHGYSDEETRKLIAELEGTLEKRRPYHEKVRPVVQRASFSLNLDNDAVYSDLLRKDWSTLSYFDKLSKFFTDEEMEALKKDAEIFKRQIEVRDRLNKTGAKVGSAPDAPFKDNYHEYVLKRLIREAAEKGYDSIGWTTADIQSERWSDEFAEGYRIEYDQDIPKFLNKYGKKWGAKVGKTNIVNNTKTKETFYDVNREETFTSFTEWQNTVRETLHEQGANMRNVSFTRTDPFDDGDDAWIAYDRETGAEYDRAIINIDPGYSEVWSMPITDAMRESVISEGQPLYQDRFTTEDRNRIIVLENKNKRLQKELDDLERAYKKAQDYARAEGILAGQIEQGAQMAKELRQKQESFNRKVEGYEKTISDKRKQIAEVRARRDELLEKAKAEKREAVANARQSALETQREIISRYQESRKKAVEGRHQTEMRHKIKGVVNELNQLLLHGTKDRHVMTGLQKAVAEALDVVNMDTIGAAERIAKYDALIAKANDPDVIASLTATRDRIKQQGENLSEKIAQLKAAYGDIENSDDPDIANGYDEVIASKIASVVSTVGNTPLKAMSMEQLENVYDMYRMVLTRIREANRSFAMAKKENISTLAGKVMMEVEKVGGKHDKFRVGTDKIRGFMWNNTKPVYAFEHIGSKTLTDVFKNVRKGEDTWAKDVTEAKEFFQRESGKYHYDRWNMDKAFSFKSKAGQNFKLTLEQIMSLYAYSKRQQADKHLELGGFVFDSNIEVVEKKKGIPVKYKVNTATAHQINKEILSEIIGKLTPEQKAFVDEMQDYLSTTMGGKGNEVSMAMYGVKLFKEKFYFPLKSAKQFMFEQNQTAGEVKVKNSGFSKETVVNAGNPIILSNFMDVWSNHVNDMSMYHAFVLPLEDFNRVFNYKTPTTEGFETESVKQFIQNAYGTEANKYISELIKDLNGGAMSDPRETMAKRLIGNFKKAAVFTSASVVIQQPSAIVRALALIDSKYFIGGKIGAKGHNKCWEEVKKYAPVAMIKEMGYFDTDMARSTVDFITAKEYSKLGKVKGFFTDSAYRDELLSIAPAKADEVAWVAIWNAVKRETKKKNPSLKPGSEEFLKAAGERFTEVITKTQVYDSVLSRSANMRSKSTFMNMMTAFMAEPTTSINMLEDALRQGKRGDKVYARKAIGAVYGSILLNSVLVSLVYAARDDEEDETYLEKYLESLTKEVTEGINPLTYLPFFKDIWSIAQGFDVERADMSLISKLVTSMENAIKVYGEDTEDMTEEELAEHAKAVAAANWDIVDNISSLVGIPVKNIRRDFNAVINLFKTVHTDIMGRKSSFGSILDNIADGFKDSIPFVDGRETKADKLYEAIMAGDEVYEARLRETVEDYQLRGALRGNDPRIREAAQARIDGDTDTYLTLAREIIADGFSQNEVVRAINTQINEMVKEETAEEAEDKLYGFFDSEDYFKAILAGDQADALAIKQDIISTSVANGRDKSTAEEKFYGSLYYDVQDAFEDGVITAAKAKEIFKKYGGKTAEDAEETVDKWVFKAEYGFDYSDRADAYKSGEISRTELKKAIMDFGGKSAEEAELQIEVYDWQKAGIDIKSNQTYIIEDYKEYWEPNGISRGVYVGFYEETKNIKADIDSKGESIPYSKTKKIMPYINELPLTPKQKTAVAKSFDWADSTIAKYKLW